MELISRQAAIDMCREPRMRNADCSDFEMEIMMLPPIQSDNGSRKIGEWIYDWGDWDFETCKCSECGNHSRTEIGKRYNFCPYCGADMREVTT